MFFALARASPCASDPAALPRASGPAASRFRSRRARASPHAFGLIFLIPKFHLPAHIAKCQTAYSFNFCRGVGRTDGEAPERGWSFIDPLASSTKEMGPASYRETIDDHFGDWNHRRIIGLGRLLLRRLKVSVPGRDDHVVDYNTFTFSLPAASVIEWSAWVKEWEEAPNGPNPFVATTKKITQHDVRLALAEEDAASITANEVSSVHDDITPGIFIAQGLEIESQQRRLKADKKALGTSPTSLQLTKMQERQNSQRRKIKTWMAVQMLYMPEVSPLRAAEARTASTQSVKTESFDVALHLPSDLPNRIRVKAILYNKGFRLRRAQAYEALDDLRGHLCLRTHMYIFKDRNLRGQSACTRSNGLLARVDRNVKATSAQYRAARTALLSLSARTGDSGWQDSLQELTEADIRAFTDDADGETQAERKKREKKNKGKPELGEGHRRISWIWMIVGVAANGENQGLQEALRIEWCKARARAMCWSEEVLLLREEMRRVLAFLAWHAVWWDLQALRHADLSPEVAEGVAAYAYKQARIRRAIRSSFDDLWTTSWKTIKHGEGVNNDILELPLSDFITSYPQLNPTSPDSPMAASTAPTP
ncbi:hypothetical protein HWV62_30143 [Athelia sp. TMB]|nr:hypothetical protein HWV62_30143 [Athelia sp. TMB]